jgi:hypothetical protein
MSAEKFRASLAGKALRKVLFALVAVGRAH